MYKVALYNRYHLRTSRPDGWRLWSLMKDPGKWMWDHMVFLGQAFES